MLFGKLNQRPGGPEIAGAVRLEPNNSDNAVIIPPLPFAPDNLPGIEEKFRAILQRGRARGLALGNSFAISVQVVGPSELTRWLSPSQGIEPLGFSISGLGGHGLRVARPGTGPGQAVIRGIERALAPIFGDRGAFASSRGAKLVQRAFTNWKSAPAQEIAELRTGHKFWLIHDFLSPRLTGCFPARFGNRIFGLNSPIA